MKKYLPHANYLAAGAGILAAVLRQWTLVVGTDDKGLYPAAHPGWIGYLAVMAAAISVFFLLARNCGKNGTWQANFPAGIFPVLGHAIAACALGIYSLSLMGTDQHLNTAAGLLALCSGTALVAAAIQISQRKAPHLLCYLLPCLFFALQLFRMGKQSGTETQLLHFLPQFLACAASALASYELTGFSAEEGNRRKSLFLSLSAAALCFAAVPGAHWLYAALGLWHLLGHCSLIEPADEDAEQEADEKEE